jgi:hypothetical protein
MNREDQIAHHLSGDANLPLRILGISSRNASREPVRRVENRYTSISRHRSSPPGRPRDHRLAKPFGPASIAGVIFLYAAGGKPQRRRQRPRRSHDLELGADQVIYVVCTPRPSRAFSIPVDPLSAGHKRITLPRTGSYTPPSSRPTRPGQTGGLRRDTERPWSLGEAPRRQLHPRHPSSAYRTVPIIIDDVIITTGVGDSPLLEAGARQRCTCRSPSPCWWGARWKAARPGDPQAVVSNTIYVAPEKRSEKLHIVSIGKLLPRRVAHSRRHHQPLLAWYSVPGRLPPGWRRTPWTCSSPRRPRRRGQRSLEGCGNWPRGADGHLRHAAKQLKRTARCPARSARAGRGDDVTSTREVLDLEMVTKRLPAGHPGLSAGGPPSSASLMRTGVGLWS